MFEYVTILVGKLQLFLYTATSLTSALLKHRITKQQNSLLSNINDNGDDNGETKNFIYDHKNSLGHGSSMVNRKNSQLRKV